MVLIAFSSPTSFYCSLENNLTLVIYSSQHSLLFARVHRCDGIELIHYIVILDHVCYGIPFDGFDGFAERFGMQKIVVPLSPVAKNEGEVI